ncbi:MAG: YqaE/Pmp3 family membrane protein [Crocinitomicaceae bacterium]
MKRQLSILSKLLIVILFTSACATSNNVATNKLIQKRKYFKGYHISNGKIEVSQKKLEETSIIQKQALHDKLVAQESNGNIKSNLKSNNTNVEAKRPIESTKIEKIEFSTYPKQSDQSVEFFEYSRKSSNQKAVKKITAKLKHEIKGTVKAKKSSSGIGTLILVLIALLIPPLAVFLKEGVTKRFWIDLILFLVGYGLGAALLGPLAWIGGLASVIYALLIVLDAI